MADEIEKAHQECLETIELCHALGPEEGHMKAEEALIKFLKKLGYNDIANEFDMLEKWYA